MSVLIPLSYGWEHEAWLTSYYPDDLPEDWRFGYFANEHAGVIVPESVWQNADADQIEEWFDDAHDNFAWVIEVRFEALSRAYEAFEPYWSSIDALYVADADCPFFHEKPIVGSAQVSDRALLLESDAITPKEWGTVLKDAAQQPAQQVFIWVKQSDRNVTLLQDVQTLAGLL